MGIFESLDRFDCLGCQNLKNSGTGIMTLAVSNGFLKKSYRNLPLDNKRVIVRVDYNVPIDKTTGAVSDDSRLRASLPTLQYLLRKKAKVILISHLGRPKGQINPKYSLKPVAKTLSDLLKNPVQFADDCIGPKAYEAVAKLHPGDVLLLENLRFHPEEEANNAVFGKELASLGDYFVQDAFGAVHRAHASTAQLPSHLPSAAGSLLEKELTFLGNLKSNPVRPFTAILGGAKVSDKIGIVEAFVQQVDNLFIGGAMAYTFLKAKGKNVGASLVENEQVEFCKELLLKAEKKNVKILLPVDHVIVQDIDKPESAKTTEGGDILDGWKGVDIGPKTIQEVKPLIQSAKTIFWNGPAGIFETPAFSKGTMEIALSVARSAKAGTTAVVGGGDSVAAVVKAGVSNDITFISTGGGASMEFLEGIELPGVKALPDREV
jgi:phosphoglycerate kinase